MADIDYLYTACCPVNARFAAQVPVRGELFFYVNRRRWIKSHFIWYIAAYSL